MLMKNGKMSKKGRVFYSEQLSTLFTVERLMFQITFIFNEIMKDICVKTNNSGERELFAYHEYGKNSS